MDIATLAVYNIVQGEIIKPEGERDLEMVKGTLRLACRTIFTEAEFESFFKGQMLDEHFGWNLCDFYE